MKNNGYEAKTNKLKGETNSHLYFGNLKLLSQ